jgi:hypothetical protein
MHYKYRLVNRDFDCSENPMKRVKSISCEQDTELLTDASRSHRCALEGLLVFTQFLIRSLHFHILRDLRAQVVFHKKTPSDGGQ